MAIITVNALALPDDNLTSYDLMRSDIDSANTGRSEDGVMVRDRIRQNVCSLEATYEMLTSEQVEQLFAATDAAQFDVVINDDDNPITKSMMRSGDIQKNMRCVGFWDVTLSLIEY